jgi:hypothetical protein
LPLRRTMRNGGMFQGHTSLSWRTVRLAIDSGEDIGATALIPNIN